MAEPIQINLSALPEIRKEFDTQIAAMTIMSLDEKDFHHALAAKNSAPIEQFSTRRGPMSCAERVIFSKESLRIADVAVLPRNEACPLMVAEQLRAYLGAPIFVYGRAVGAVELMADQPRNWQQPEETAIKALAQVYGQDLEAMQSKLDNVVVPFAAR